MKKFIACMLVILAAPQGMAQSHLTLEYCQEQARKNYPLIHQYDLIERSEEYTLSNINNNFLPQFDLSLVGGVVDGFPSFSPTGDDASSPEYKLIAMAQINQMIWDGGTTHARKDIEKASHAVETAEVQASLYAIRDRVNNIYMGVLLIDEQMRQLELLRANLERNLKRVQTAIEHGTANTTDMDEIQVKIIETLQNVDEMEHNRSAWLGVLSAMTATPIDARTELERPLVEDRISKGQIQRPELIKFSQMEHLANSQSQLNHATLYPKIGITGFGVFIHPSINFGMSETGRLLLGGLSLNWNLQGLYGHGNNKKLTGIQLDKINNQREAFLFNTHLSLIQIAKEMEKYSTLIKRDEEIIELKERIRKSYEVRYENGISTMSELLDRINEESVARTKRSVHDIQYAMKALQYKYEKGN